MALRPVTYRWARNVQTKAIRRQSLRANLPPTKIDSTQRMQRSKGYTARGHKIPSGARVKIQIKYR